MRRFNTEGPIHPEDHYHVSPMEGVDLDQILDMLRRKRYFVLHAPRQKGKTSALIALRDLLNRGSPFNVAAKSLCLGDFSESEWAGARRPLDRRLGPVEGAA